MLCIQWPNHVTGSSKVHFHRSPLFSGGASFVRRPSQTGPCWTVWTIRGQTFADLLGVHWWFCGGMVQGSKVHAGTGSLIGTQSTPA